MHIKTKKWRDEFPFEICVKLFFKKLLLCSQYMVLFRFRVRFQLNLLFVSLGVNFEFRLIKRNLLPALDSFDFNSKLIFCFRLGSTLLGSGSGSETELETVIKWEISAQKLLSSNDR